MYSRVARLLGLTRAARIAISPRDVKCMQIYGEANGVFDSFGDSVLSTFSIVSGETDVTGIGIVPHFGVWFGLAGTQECLFPTRPSHVSCSVLCCIILPRSCC